MTIVSSLRRHYPYQVQWVFRHHPELSARFGELPTLIILRYGRSVTNPIRTVKSQDTVRCHQGIQPNIMRFGW